MLFRGNLYWKKSPAESGESNMLPAEVTHQVFQIAVGGSLASAFTIEHNGRQYLVSAAHVFPQPGDHEKLRIYQNNARRHLPVALVGIDRDADTVVLQPPVRIAPKSPLTPSAHGVSYSQDVYFLGFPFGITPSGSPTDRPFPFVKKACLSAVNVFSDKTVFYLDGHNNPGFSGGPVVFQRRDGRASVLSVVSGYRTDERPVRAKGEELPITFRENTGIIISYDIKHAIHLIDKTLITGADAINGV